MNPSYNNPHNSTVVLVLIPLLIRAVSLLDSVLVSVAILATLLKVVLSTEGNIMFNNSVSSASVNTSISTIVNLSIKALSITRVEVYSLPMFAVATNVTPSATLIVSEPVDSSSLKYLCP